MIRCDPDSTADPADSSSKDGRMSFDCAGKYDLAFVGSGIACTMTLLELSTLLTSKPRPAKALQIAVIEKETEFWSGIAYGVRSAPASLVITSLREFVDEAEKPAFIQWLDANQHHWVEHLRRHGGEAGAQWIHANSPLIHHHDWDA